MRTFPEPTSLNRLTAQPEVDDYPDPARVLWEDVSDYNRNHPFWERTADFVPYEPMRWEGPVSALLRDIGPVAAAGETSSESLKGVLWHPSLITRAVIDSSIEGDDRIRLINATTNLGVGLYAGQPIAHEYETLSEQLTSAGLAGATVTQSHDEVTHFASFRSRAAGAAAVLAWTIPEGKRLLVMPICYSGFLPGIRTALEYRRRRPDADIRLYPFRFSMHKLGDTEPRLTPEEERYVQQIGRGRTIVLVDDDASRGETLQSAVSHMKALFPRSRVIGVANRDYRTGDARDRQGRLWQRRQLRLRDTGKILDSLLHGR